MLRWNFYCWGLETRDQQSENQTPPKTHKTGPCLPIELPPEACGWGMKWSEHLRLALLTYANTILTYFPRNIHFRTSSSFGYRYALRKDKSLKGNKFYKGWCAASHIRGAQLFLAAPNQNSMLPQPSIFVRDIAFMFCFISICSHNPGWEMNCRPTSDVRQEPCWSQMDRMLPPVHFCEHGGQTWIQHC